MKRKNKAILAFVVLSLMSCSTTGAQRSAKQTWQDSVVSTKVKYKLTKEKEIHKRNMNVDVHGGVVTITGRAMSEVEKNQVTEVAAATKGVRGVENYLVVVGQEPLVVTSTTTTETAEVTALEVASADTNKNFKPTGRYSHLKRPTHSPVLTTSEDVQESDLPEPSIPATPTATPTTTSSATSKTVAAIPDNLNDTGSSGNSENVATGQTPQVPLQKAPAVIVQNKSPKGGLPWAGEVVETDDTTDAMMINNPATYSKAARKKTAARSTQAADHGNPVVDKDVEELARQAARELEKLRNKK